MELILGWTISTCLIIFFCHLNIKHLLFFIVGSHQRLQVKKFEIIEVEEKNSIKLNDTKKIKFKDKKTHI